MLTRNINSPELKSKEDKRNPMENRGFIHIIERKAQHLGNKNNKHTLSTYYMSAAIQELYMY